MSKFALSATAFALAAAAFWSTMITSPPKSEAAVVSTQVNNNFPAADHCISFSACP